MHGRSKYCTAPPWAGIWEGEKHGDSRFYASDHGNMRDDRTPDTHFLGSLSLCFA